MSSRKDLFHPKLRGRRLKAPYMGSAHEIGRKHPRSADLDVFERQRERRGFDDTEMWSLDRTFAAWFAPRVRRFRALADSHPPDVTMKEWRAELRAIQRGLEILAASEGEEEHGREDVKEALALFAKRLRHMWI